MTADHWGFVIGAYGLVAVVLIGYWRRLVNRERALSRTRLVSSRQADQRAPR